MLATGRSLFLILLLFLGIFLCPGIQAAHAQSEMSPVHIEPRVRWSPSTTFGDNSSSTIRTRVDLVLVPVTITDGLDRAVVGLDQRNFQLYEGKQPQEIKHFFSEDGPVSIGVILDMSSSMKTKIERAREAVEEFLKAANPQDEFFLITFADRPQVVQDFTQKAENIEEGLLYMKPKGSTALLDAIYMAVGKMKTAKYQRKALLVISDGGDNHSRYTEHEVKSLTKEADVLIYSVGIFDREFASREEILGPALLTELSEVTGARCYTLDDSRYLPTITRHIGVQLRNQYVLAYRPNIAKEDGKWRKIKVKLTLLPRSLPHVRVHAKTGYYAPLQ
jgi:Ca-activated chloride channel family protein